MSPALVALRDRVRNALATQQQQAFSTRENTATEIMSFCLAFGCGPKCRRKAKAGKRINGITCLCWNYPCAGFEMSAAAQGHIAARIGYGFQEHPGEFLAMLASRASRPTIRCALGKNVRKVADVVEAEKLACRSAATSRSACRFGLLRRRAGVVERPGRNVVDRIA